MADPLGGNPSSYATERAASTGGSATGAATARAPTPVSYNGFDTPAAAWLDRRFREIGNVELPGSPGVTITGLNRDGVSLTCETHDGDIKTVPLEIAHIDRLMPQLAGVK